MYGIMFELDAHVLEDELGLDRKEAHRLVERKLESAGHVRVRYGVLVCPNPKTNEMLVVHETIEALKDLEWFAPAVSRLTAFKLESWGDLTEAFK